MNQISYEWCGRLSQSEQDNLPPPHGDQPFDDWWQRIGLSQLGWITARGLDGAVFGLVKIVWDGEDDAFLHGVQTGLAQRGRGISSEMVKLATDHARSAGCDWLHVDFDPDLAAHYQDVCLIAPSPIQPGLIRLNPAQT